MNKMAKGAIAAGVGVILLAGGGGTLATWNQANNASMGSVVSGDLNLVAGAGVWKNAANTTIPNIADYKVVPGDTLTYTQPLTVTLTGNLMTAKLAVTGASAANGFGDQGVVSATTLTNARNGQVLPDAVLVPADSGQVTATTTFTFKSTTTGRDAVNSSVNLGGIGYKLEQQAPVSSNTK